MSHISRRAFLAGASSLLSLPPAIARALSIDADRRSGTLRDVAHVVIFMQENRAFDHYFGSLSGVRGFGDRFPIPLSRLGASWRTVWQQPDGARARLLPFHLDTRAAFADMRVKDTPHTWPDAQAAWDQGRLRGWPQAKTARSMGYYRREDIPFQFALAEAFTLCDAYHCSIQAGTNPNRIYLWTGTNDGRGTAGGPAIGNSHDRLVAAGGARDPYLWSTYTERLQAAGIGWRVYQDMADNYNDNPLAGFKAFRDAAARRPGSDPQLLRRGLSTWTLDDLRHDVLADRLPQVSYIVAPASQSEHPAASCPAQGADYTARVLEALTARPEVWSRTVLLLMFDENDGFFDHMPPPAPPSRDASQPSGFAGASTVSTRGEYHLVESRADAALERPAYLGRPYGLGARVPMYVISPWSRGGWVDSQVFDHTSVIRFLERRFGVAEPNISAWRRAVCGDLTSTLDFARPNDSGFLDRLPPTHARAARAAALPGHIVPPPPPHPRRPVQARGTRPSRPLPYRLEVGCAATAGAVHLSFLNPGTCGAVFHVYDRLHLDRVPRRYTVEAGKSLEDLWPLGADAGAYDLWVLAPNGFHRHFRGHAGDSECALSAHAEAAGPALALRVHNPGRSARTLEITPRAYAGALQAWRVALAPQAGATRRWSLAATGGWYDLQLSVRETPGFSRRLAGRVESGADSISDPALGGAAILRQS